MNYNEFLEEWRNGTPYIKVHTSGSTGKPKSIELDKQFVIRSAERTNRFFGITSESHLHSCISPDFIGGKMMAVRADLANCRLTWEIPTNQPLKDYDYDDIDLLSVVPSQMDYILNNLDNLPGIKSFLIGGSAIPLSLRERIEKSGINAFESYGMTETASHIALRKVTSDPFLPFRTLGDIVIGKDERGCLTITIPGSDKIVTNDLATLISDKEFLIDGRYDHVIISGGRKINPLEIENLIHDLIPYPFMIIGLPDDKWGRKVVMVIEKESGESLFHDSTENGSHEPIDRQIIKKIRNRLENWQIPKEIRYVKSLPHTSNGKLIRSIETLNSPDFPFPLLS